MAEEQVVDLKDRLKQLEEEGAAKKPERPKTSNDAMKDQSSYFPLDTDDQFAEVADEFQNRPPVERKPLPQREPPPEDPFEKLRAIAKKVEEFLKDPKVQRYSLRMKDTGPQVIIYQGSFNNIWARIDRNGVIHVYRGILERQLIKAGIMEAPDRQERAGEPRHR